MKTGRITIEFEYTDRDLAWEYLDAVERLAEDDPAGDDDVKIIGTRKEVA